MKLPRAIAAIAAAVVATGGCFGHYGRTDRSWRRPKPALRVTNQNWKDVTVFVVRGATRSRVGYVNALSEARFALSSGVAVDGSLRLLLDPIGGDAVFMTEAIAIGPGQLVELTITPSLGMSYLAVWRDDRPPTRVRPR